MYKRANLPPTRRFFTFHGHLLFPFPDSNPRRCANGISRAYPIPLAQRQGPQIADLHRNRHAQRTTLPIVPQDTPKNSHRLALIKVEKKQITKNTVTEEGWAEITAHQYSAAPWEARGINWDYHINATKNRKYTIEVCSVWVFELLGFSKERCDVLTMSCVGLPLSYTLQFSVSLNIHRSFCPEV